MIHRKWWKSDAIRNFHLPLKSVGLAGPTFRITLRSSFKSEIPLADYRVHLIKPLRSRDSLLKSIPEEDKLTKKRHIRKMKEIIPWNIKLNFRLSRLTRGQNLYDMVRDITRFWIEASNNNIDILILQCDSIRSILSSSTGTESSLNYTLRNFWSSTWPVQDCHAVMRAEQVTSTFQKRWKWQKDWKREGVLTSGYIFLGLRRIMNFSEMLFSNLTFFLLFFFKIITTKDYYLFLVITSFILE